MIAFFLLYVFHALCASALDSSPIGQVNVQSRDLEDRETPCIALSNCGSHSDPPVSSSTSAPLPPITTISQASSSLLSTSTSSPSTPTPSAQDTIQYLLFPKTGADQNDTDTFEKLLINIVGDAGKIFASSISDVGVVFWAAPLSPDQAKECGSHGLVSSSGIA